MIGSRDRKRKTMAKGGTAALLASVKVVAAPKSVARRKLLSGPDITASGGCRMVDPLARTDSIVFHRKPTADTKPSAPRCRLPSAVPALLLAVFRDYGLYSKGGYTASGLQITIVVMRQKGSCDGGHNATGLGTSN